MQNKAQKWVFEALMHVKSMFPVPIIGIDSDNGSEFINDHLYRYCLDNKITFTRSRPLHKNDGTHVEQKNWSRGGTPGSNKPKPIDAIFRSWVHKVSEVHGRGFQGLPWFALRDRARSMAR